MRGKVEILDDIPLRRIDYDEYKNFGFLVGAFSDCCSLVLASSDLAYSITDGHVKISVEGWYVVP